MHSAKVIGRNLPISTKHAIVISNFIRGKKLGWAKNKLGQVLEKKVAVPYTVHVRSIPHRKGKMATGRYPVKASAEVIKLLKSAEANALNKGLDIEELYINKIMPNLASRPRHPGRQMRTQMKRTHIEIVLEERVKEKRKKEAKKEPAKKTKQEENKK